MLEDAIQRTVPYLYGNLKYVLSEGDMKIDRAATRYFVTHELIKSTMISACNHRGNVKVQKMVGILMRAIRNIRPVTRIMNGMSIFDRCLEGIADNSVHIRNRNSKYFSGSNLGSQSNLPNYTVFDGI